MKSSFENSVNVLVRAYLNDTLEHCNCFACAVGNLVVAACGYNYDKEFIREQSSVGFKYPLVTKEHSSCKTMAGGSWYPLYDGNSNADSGMEIASTGYTVEQLRQIENAFEDHAYGPGDNNFSGLMAVVDVLADIHGVDLSTKESAKAMFVKA